MNLLDRLYNLHWVTDGAARSAQPYLGFYKTFLAAHRFRSLINLRGENAHISWWRREGRVCTELGIARFDVRLSSRKLPLREVLVSLFDAFAAAPLPLLFKCSGGQDRTSLAAALYLLHIKGAGALNEAQAQFAAWPYLHLPKRHQNWLKQFPLFAVENAHDVPLKQWASTVYDPQTFAEWLNARGLQSSYDGLQRLRQKVRAR
jgi:hypothetical protein